MAEKVQCYGCGSTNVRAVWINVDCPETDPKEGWHCDGCDQEFATEPGEDDEWETSAIEQGVGLYPPDAP
jgi:hypothetical protein